MNSKSEMQGHLSRNEEMWKIWEERGVTPETELTVNFHFYSTSKRNADAICKVFQEENIPFRVKKTRTMLIFTGWTIEADIKKKWTLAELQGKTGNMFVLAQQTGVSLEGCGAYMPRQ